MNRKLIVRLFLIFLTIASYSCRTDETMREEERSNQEKIMVFMKFHEKNALSKSVDETSYAYPFAELLENYFYNHPKYAEAFLKDVGTIDIHIASQTFLDRDEKIVFFPILEEEKVTAIIQCTVNADETYVSFKVLKTEVPAEMRDVINQFQRYYDKSDSVASRVQDIKEIVITVYQPRDWSGSGIDYNPWGSSGSGVGGSMNGGSGVHGGWGGTSNSNTSNPCDKTKSLINNDKTKPAINALKTKSTQGGENGYKIKADGTPSNEIPGGAHSVNFGDKTGYAGGYHNHTPTGIPMLSPPDVDQLLGFARAQGNYGDPTKAFVGMVAPNGMHYVIWFNGTYQDAITNFSQEQLDEYTDRYQTRYGMYKPSYGDMSNEEIEKFFFRALIDMGLDGKINLQRVENDGKVKMIIKNTDGTTTATPCS